MPLVMIETKPDRCEWRYVCMGSYLAYDFENA